MSGVINKSHLRLHTNHSKKTWPAGPKFRFREPRFGACVRQSWQSWLIDGAPGGWPDCKCVQGAGLLEPSRVRNELMSAGMKVF